MQNPITGDPLSVIYLKVIVLSGLALFILLFYVRGTQTIAELKQQYRISKDEYILRKLNLLIVIYNVGLGLLAFFGFVLMILFT
jgi:hypothetical protein